MNRLNRRDTIKTLAWGATATLGAPLGYAAGNTQTPATAAGQWPPVDVLICGGGPAGIAAALMAARCGAKTLLVERYGRLGGMAVQAMVGPLMGNVRSEWVDGILAHIGGRRVDYERLDLKYAELLDQAGSQFLLHAWAAAPLLDGRRVTGARLLTKQGLIDVRARVTVDATGDGDVAVGAGAEFDQGREAGPNWDADGLVQPMTIMFRVSGVDHAESMEAKGGRGAYRFPDGRSWNQLTKDANARGELPATVGMVRTYRHVCDGSCASAKIFRNRATSSGCSAARSCCSARSASRSYKRIGESASLCRFNWIAFHLPMRAARFPPCSKNSQYKYSCSFCCSGLPNNVGSMLMPSISSGGSIPAMAQAVGRKSQWAEIRWLSTPAGTVPGQRTISGTRMPPSVRSRL
jgi:hypothetical protein